jgi:uncharacterized protein with HEPN domain
MKENDNLHLRHILESIEKINRLTESKRDGLDFSSDEAVYNASLYLLATIGEAVSSLSDGFKEEHTQVPWKNVEGMRNILIHEYLNVSPIIVWKTIQERLPELEVVIKNALK